MVAPARDLARIEAGAGGSPAREKEAAAQKSRGPDPLRKDKPPGQTRRVGPVVVVVSAAAGAVSTSAARAKPK
jgi:hypothetical protein